MKLEDIKTGIRTDRYDKAGYYLFNRLEGCYVSRAHGKCITMLTLQDLLPTDEDTILVFKMYSL